MTSSLPSSVERLSIASSCGSEPTFLGDIESDQLLQLVETVLVPLVQQRRTALEAQVQLEKSKMTTVSSTGNQGAQSGECNSNSGGSWYSYVFGGGSVVAQSNSVTGDEKGTEGAVAVTAKSEQPHLVAETANQGTTSNGQAKTKITATITTTTSPNGSTSNNSANTGSYSTSTPGDGMTTAEQERWKIAYEILLNEASHVPVSYWTPSIKSVLTSQLGVYSSSDLSFCTAEQLRSLSRYLKPIQRNKFLVHCNISSTGRIQTALP